VDLAGGAGGVVGEARGGAGGAGRVRFDADAASATVTAGDNVQGVRFDLASIPPIVREPVVVVSGFAAPGTRVRVQDELNGVVRMRMEATADAGGRWTIPFGLIPGAATLVAYAVVGTTAVPSFSGATVVVRTSGEAREIYSGAVDVVYVPMTE
jgi:hypothetical protein